jgi:hypothetical protein
MGMYTAFRASAVIQEKYRAAISVLHEKMNWDDVYEHHPTFPLLSQWVNVYRKNFIPFGSGGFIPNSWGDDTQSSYDPNTGVWTFCCTLKNYEDEIAQFLAMFLEIIESINYCESQHESGEPIHLL